MLPLLGIETSGEVCSVSLMVNEQHTINAEIKKKHVHSEKLFNLAEAVLKEAGLKVTDLVAIAVGEGPGSFTGLRIGYSAAKGIAAGARLPIISVPGFEAMALDISRFLMEGEEFVICNKVNITELYYARFAKSDKYFRIVDELKLIEQKDFENIVEKNVRVLGDYVKKDKMLYYSCPSAEYINKWAYIFGEDLLTFDVDNLEPRYLKNFVARSNK